MGDTYNSAAEAETDRAQLRALLAALNAWDRALRRDECGAWCVAGERGSIHTWGDGKSWALYVACRSVRPGRPLRRALAFCGVTQDGDDEGVLSVIREVLGIRKRQEISAATLDRLRAFALERSTRGEANSSSGKAGDII